ncbi:MAG: hypothetical protein IJF66_01185 [Clostridia bacterium]|nr:hypothetical protein [Clostridia bacterium]
MMTKKTMTIVSVFMVVALTAVGFAAWLITGTIDYKAEGSFVANELDDKYFKVEVEFDADLEDTDTTKGNVVFGRPVTEDVAANQSWLSYSVNDEEQKLKVVATVKFIPDGGFSKKDGDKREMDYYLYQEIESKSGDDVVITKQYRTIRVKIDINELLDNDGNPDPSSEQFKWFDMAVQLGYIQYPTAHVVEEGKTYATATNKLSWVKNELDEQGALQDLTAETDKFRDGYLYIDLTWDMFEIQYADENATEATEAIVKIEINFNWGLVVSETTEGENPTTTYFNPYTFFADKKPETNVNLYTEYGITKYLKGTGANAQLKDMTIENTEDPENIDERDQGLDTDCIIRNKDIAQRLLDYVRDYLNYTPADADTAASGLQFSFELLEGEPKAFTNSNN